MRFEYCEYCGLTMGEDGDYETGSFEGDCKLALTRPCVFSEWGHSWRSRLFDRSASVPFDTDNELGRGVFNDLKNHAKRGISFKARCKCGGVSKSFFFMADGGEAIFATYIDAVHNCTSDNGQDCQLRGHKIKVFDQNGNEMDEPEYMKTREYEEALKLERKRSGIRRGLFGF